MTMEAMDKYLRDKGFSVTRRYYYKIPGYVFTIRKGDNLLSEEFKYPGRESYSEKNRIMQDFLDNLIYDFERKFPEMKTDTTNFMNDLRSSGASAGILINGHYYPVYITGATIDHSLNEAANIEIEAQVLRECPNASSSYIDTDIAMTQLVCARGNGKTNNMVKHMMNSIFGLSSSHVTGLLAIEKVIFNYPATIVIWKDGTKTVVKAQNDEVFDKEKGLVMAMIKKALGNEGNYYEHIKKWLGEV